MAKYPIKMLLDELKRPFFPLVTIDTIVTNNSDKTLKELFDDRYTKAEVDKIISDLGTLQRLRGTVNSYEELLAIENPLPGDTYILLVESGINAEYMYIGDRWEMLGTTATYTDVYSKAVIDEMLLALKQEINAKSELDDAEILSQAKIYAEDLFANVPRPNLDDYYKKSETDAKIDEKISAYEPPIASTDTLGTIKVGRNLSVDADGTLNADENKNANVIDNLTSTSTTDALSANMGRELNERLANIAGSSSNLVNYTDEEQFIGYYNGDKLYRKRITGTVNQTYADTWWANIPINKVKALVNFGGSLYDTADTTGNSFSTNYHARMVRLTSGNLRLDIADKYFANKYFDCWVEYTRET